MQTKSPYEDPPITLQATRNLRRMRHLILPQINPTIRAFLPYPD